MRTFITAWTALAITCAAFVSTPALADPGQGKGNGKPGFESKAIKKSLKYKSGGPPPWAPAHGYRAKGGHPDYYAATYQPPFGIDLGRCNSDVIGALIGGAAGGALGSTIGQGTGKTAAIVGGTILGVIIGGSIGRSMDQVDMTCVGQALEHAPTGQAVNWTGTNGYPYLVKPLNAFENPAGQHCREYTMTATIKGVARSDRATACRLPDGAWKKVD